MIISLDNIEKSFKSVIALDRISFEVDKGELFGLIGPDGAGKTTLLRIVTTLLKPSGGKATIHGMDSVADFKKIRPLLGYMPGRFSLYTDLTVEENLRFFASIFGTSPEENYELVKDIYIQIESFKHRKAGALSGGMKQKLALSCALIHKPELLVLDEPTTGVDAVSRREFWDMLDKLKNQGITIIVSTPYMDEALRCDRIAMIQSGKILGIDKPDIITSYFSKKLYAVTGANKFNLLKTLREYEFSDTVYPFGETVHYTDKRGEFNKKELEIYLKNMGIKDSKVYGIEAGIEDTFMDLMKNE